MFLGNLDEYLGTTIIFVSVILVIILAYLIFFMPKGKRIKEQKIEKERVEDKVEAKKPEIVVTKDTKLPPQNLVKLEPFKFEKRDNEIKPAVKKELPVEEIDEPVNLEELEKHAETENVEQEMKTDESSAEAAVVEAKDETLAEKKEVKEDSKELGKYHVLYRKDDNKWYIKREGSDKILRVLETQAEAIAWATIKALNQDSAIVIHKRDGKIRKQNY
ncbi:MAG: DUF2188 domain-containing protein [Candidatus Izemoplasmatales bacterium]